MHRGCEIKVAGGSGSDVIQSYLHECIYEMYDAGLDGYVYMCERAEAG